MKINKTNYFNYITQYEQDGLERGETIELFAYLIKNGLCWSLQGHYGRMATWFIENEVISKEGKIL